jgi:hypothetical protein
MFLEPKQLEELTGRKMPSAQIRQLENMGITFLVNGLNRPIVSVSEVENVLSQKGNTKTYTLNRAAIKRPTSNA